MFAHGTIMFDSDVNEVVNALKVRKDKIESKGIKSIRSRVTNIKPFLDDEYQDLTTVDFRQDILLRIFGVDALEDVKTYELTESDWEKINQISDKYYRNWDWNFGKSPDFDIIKRERFPISSIEVRLNVSGGVIKEAKSW